MCYPVCKYLIYHLRHIDVRYSIARPISEFGSSVGGYGNKPPTARLSYGQERVRADTFRREYTVKCPNACIYQSTTHPVQLECMQDE